MTENKLTKESTALTKETVITLRIDAAVPHLETMPSTFSTPPDDAWAFRWGCKVFLEN